MSDNWHGNGPKPWLEEIQPPPAGACSAAAWRRKNVLRGKDGVIGYAAAEAGGHAEWINARPNFRPWKSVEDDAEAIPLLIGQSGGSGVLDVEFRMERYGAEVTIKARHQNPTIAYAATRAAIEAMMERVAYMVKRGKS